MAQRSSIGARDSEGVLAECRNINEVDRTPWLDENDDQGKCSLSRKIVAFQIDIQARL